MGNAAPTAQQQTLRERGICVVIPTYNNGSTIADVVRRTLAQCLDVIVVNDGSTDGTRQALQAIGGITLVDYADNRGKGTALKRGFRKALELGFAYAITLDGDGQHYPEDIALLLAANRQHPDSLIIGDRFGGAEAGGAEPAAAAATSANRSKGSVFANRFSNFWFWVQTGCRLNDTQTGYRLYPLHRLRGLALLTSRYEAELELLVLASWHGVRLVAQPVRVYYPPKELRVSHFRPAADFARISVLNTVLCLLAVVYGLPLRLWRALLTLVRTAGSLLFFVFFIWVVITPAAWLYVKLGPMTERKRQGLHRLIYHAARIVMLRIGIPGTRFTHHEAEGTDFSRPRVVICNHQSHLDLMCQLIFTPNIVFLTNDWVWRNPFYGFLIRHAEYYPVRNGIDELMPRLRSLAERGYSIAVYPEGTRSADCRIGRFHQGAFHIAAQLGLEVLPMYLYGPGRVLPKKAYTLRPGRIHVEVGQPLTPAQLLLKGSDARSQASAMRRHYVEMYEKLANRIERMKN